MPVSFELRLGFDAIFSAIGFIGAVVTVVVVGVGFVVGVVGVVAVFGDLPWDVVAVDAVVVDGDFVGLPVVVGLADVDVVVGLPADVGLPPPCAVVVVVGLPGDVGRPVLVGFAVAGLLVGFPAVDGFWGGGALCAPATAGDSVRDVAATSPRNVAESRIRIPPRLRSRKHGATPTIRFQA
jgi:hypothetical protein